MKTLIPKKPIFRFPPSSNLFFLQIYNNHNFLRIHPKNGLKTPTLYSTAPPQSLRYGGWDDSQFTGDSVDAGEVIQFRDLLSSYGIGGKKYVFVYLFGFVCALAISRVKVSSIMVFPACAVVFAVGFLVGLVKGGHLNELKSNGNRKKLIDQALRVCVEKVKAHNLGVLELKNSIRKSIECNRVTVSDLEGYIDFIESIDMSLRNTIDGVESLYQSNQEKEGGSDHETSRRRKKSDEKGLSFSHYFDGWFGGMFGGPNSGKMEGSDKMKVMDADTKLENILASPIKERNLKSASGECLEDESASMFDYPFDSSSTARNRDEKFIDGTRMGNIDAENEEKNVGKAVFDRTIYTYQNKTSRFVNNKQIHLKDYQDEIENVSYHNNSYDSVDVSISMNHIKTAASSGHQQKHEAMNRNYLHLESGEDGVLDSHRYPFEKGAFSPKNRHSFANQESAHENIFCSSPSPELSDDLKFNRYLAEANDLLKEAKGCLTQRIDDVSAERALHKSAILLLKAIDMRPMSLLAVGQLGNTYLLHGELKLRMSRDLRTLLARTDSSSVEGWGKVGYRSDNQLTGKVQITSALVGSCEECEKLLINAGRKYRMALSIDGNDMRALYNWGLALSFHAQLIADIGPSAACDADKIFLAAIDKFDAMMSKSNVYASDALFRWGTALQHRSRLRPDHSREKVKLLQQARRLYEDALHTDSENPQLQRALSSCISELDCWYT